MKKIISLVIMICLVISVSVSAGLYALAAVEWTGIYANAGETVTADHAANSYTNGSVNDMPVLTEEGTKTLKFYDALVDTSYRFESHIRTASAGMYTLTLEYFVQVGINENIPIAVCANDSSEIVMHDFARGEWEGGIDTNNRKGPLMTTSVTLELAAGENTIAIYNPLASMDVWAGFVYIHSLKLSEMPLSIVEGGWQIGGMGGEKESISSDSFVLNGAEAIQAVRTEKIDLAQGFSATLLAENAQSGNYTFAYRKGAYAVEGQITIPDGTVTVRSGEGVLTEVTGNALKLTDCTKPIKVNLTANGERFAFSFENNGYTSFSRPFAVPAGGTDGYEFVFTMDTSAGKLGLSGCTAERIVPASANGFETLNGATVRQNDDGTATFIFNDARFAYGTAERSTRERITSTQGFDLNEIINLQFHISGISALHYVGIRLSASPYDVPLDETAQNSYIFTYFSNTGLGIANWNGPDNGFSYNPDFRQTSVAEYVSTDDLDRITIQFNDDSTVVTAIGQGDEPCSPPSPINWGKTYLQNYGTKVYVTFELRIRAENNENVHPELTLMPVNTSTKAAPDEAPEAEFVGGQFIRLKEDVSGLYEYAITADAGQVPDVWTSDKVFSGLEKNTKYYIYPRYKQTNQYLASEAGTPLEVTTSNAFTMSFVMNGADVTYDPISSESEPFARPSDPVRRGYTFEGWYSDEAFTVQYDWQKAADDVILYAKWQVNRYSVTFDTGVEGYTLEGQTADYGGLFTDPQIDGTKKPNYYFAGWYYDKGHLRPYDFSTPVSDQDIVLYAYWLGDLKTVSFETNGAEEILDKSVHYGDTVVIHTMPTRAGYTFLGWYTDATLTQSWDIMEDTVSDNMVLYAKWERLPVQQADLSGGGEADGFLIAGIVVLSVCAAGAIAIAAVYILRKKKDGRKR